MRLILSTIALGQLAISATALHAQTLVPISGETLVSRGGAFQVVKSPMGVQTGDFVFVNPGGAAQVSYSSNCSLPVSPGEVLTVAASIPCSPNNQNNQSNQSPQQNANNQPNSPNGNGPAQSPTGADTLASGQAAEPGAAAGAAGEAGAGAGGAGAGGAAGGAAGAAAGVTTGTMVAVGVGVAAAVAVGVAVSNASGSSDKKAASP